MIIAVDIPIRVEIHDTSEYPDDEGWTIWIPLNDVYISIESSHPPNIGCEIYQDSDCGQSITDIPPNIRTVTFDV